MNHPYLAEAQGSPLNFCHRGKDHQNMPIVMICLEKQCGHQRKCCLTCIDQLHRKHEIVSLGKFRNYIEKILSHNFLIDNRTEVMKLINDSHQDFINKLQDINQNFQSQIEQAKNNISLYFKTIKDSFVEQKYQNKLKQLSEQFTDHKINQLYKLTKQTEQNLVKSSNEIKVAMANTSKLLLSKSQSLLKDIEKHIPIIEKVIISFKITGQIKSNKFKFNSETIANSLQLTGDKKKVTRSQGTGGYPIVLVDQPFTELNNQIKFMITEQLQKKGVWMGVCVRDIVKNFDYKSCYGLNKGAWAIDQVGQNHTSAYSWSHHDSNFNSSPKVGWQFSIGDIITIKVDFQKSVVIFKKNEEIYEQPIQLNLGSIYAFAGPTNLGDSIQIA